MFRANEEKKVRIVSGGIKECVVAFPTDAQWCDLYRRIEVVRHNLGRDKSKRETPGAEDAKANLFLEIRRDVKGPEFDRAEAAKVIDRLERAEVASVEREGDQFSVFLTVFGNRETVHRVGMPTQQAIRDYGRSSISMVDQRRLSTMKQRLEPAGTLYDGICVITEGYDGPIPIVHKEAVVNEIIMQVESLMDEPDPED